MTASALTRAPEGPIPLTFGVRLPNSGPHATADNLLRIAGAAERLDYPIVWVHDHLPWASAMLTHFSTGSIEACGDQPPAFFETITTIGLVAGRHPRLDVGIAGLVLPLRDPRVLAKQLMTLQVLTGGRVVTALAIGNIPNDFEVMDVPYRRRGRITDDHLAALRAIYDDDPSTHDGAWSRFTDAELHPKPADARFWIAGNSPPAYRRIASSASGWLPGGLSPDRFAEDLARVAEVLEAAGRSVAALHRGLELYLCLEPTRDAAVEVAARSLEHRFGSVEEGVERNLVGGPDEVAERIDRYRAAGVTHLELRVVAHSIEAHEETLERFAADVRPRIDTSPVP